MPKPVLLSDDDTDDDDDNKHDNGKGERDDKNDNEEVNDARANNDRGSSGREVVKAVNDKKTDDTAANKATGSEKKTKNKVRETPKKVCVNPACKQKIATAALTCRFCKTLQPRKNASAIPPQCERILNPRKVCVNPECKQDLPTAIHFCNFCQTPQPKRTLPQGKDDKPRKYRKRPGHPREGPKKDCINMDCQERIATACRRCRHCGMDQSKRKLEHGAEGVPLAVPLVSSQSLEDANDDVMSTQNTHDNQANPNLVSVTQLSTEMYSSVWTQHDQDITSLESLQASVAAATNAARATQTNIDNGRTILTSNDAASDDGGVDDDVGNTGVGGTGDNVDDELAMGVSTSASVAHQNAALQNLTLPTPNPSSSLSSSKSVLSAKAPPTDAKPAESLGHPRVDDRQTMAENDDNFDPESLLEFTVPGEEDEDGVMNDRLADGEFEGGNDGMDILDPFDEDMFGMLGGGGGGRKGKEKRGRGRPKGKAGKQLPSVAQNAMGEANSAYIQGDFQKAAAICLEIIKDHAQHNEPYDLLAIIHEQTGEMDKALNYWLVSSKLTPTDGDLWANCVRLALELSKPDLHAYCLGQVVRCKPDDENAVQDFVALTRSLEGADQRKCLDTLRKVLTLRNHDSALSRTVAEMFYERGDLPGAIRQLEKSFEAASSKRGGGAAPDLDIANLLAEMYNEDGKWDMCINHIEKLTLRTPLESMPIDIAVKYAVALVNTDAADRAQGIIAKLANSDPSSYSDLFVELGDVLSAASQHDDALTLYEPLLLPGGAFEEDVAVNVKAGMCHFELYDLVAAQQRFEKALKIDPTHLQARLQLSEVFKAMGKKVESIAVLEMPRHSAVAATAGEDIQKARLDLKLQRAIMQLGYGEEALFLDLALPIVVETMDHLRAISRARVAGKRRRSGGSRGEGDGGSTGGAQASSSSSQDSWPAGGEDGGGGDGESTDYESDGYNSAFATDLEYDSGSDGGGEGGHVRSSSTDVLSVAPLRSSRKRRASSCHESESVEKLRKLRKKYTAYEALGVDEFYNLVVQVSRALVAVGRYAWAFRVVNRAMKMRQFEAVWMQEQLRKVATAIAFNLEDYGKGFKLVREVCRKHPHSIKIWNFFSRFLCRSDVIYQQRRFHQRLMLRNLSSVPLSVVVANTCAHTGSHRSALSLFFNAYKAYPNDAFLNFSIGVSYLMIVMSRSQPNRHAVVLKAVAFLTKYLRLTGGSAEGHYNVGRAFHHIGLTSYAMHYYTKALELTAALRREGASPAVDLTKEIAFNICLIHKAAGKFDLARRVMCEHLVI